MARLINFPSLSLVQTIRSFPRIDRICDRLQIISLRYLSNDFKQHTI